MKHIGKILAGYGLLFLMIVSILIFQAYLMPEYPVWITDNGNKIMTAMRLSGPDRTDTFRPSVLIENADEYFPGDFHFHKVASDGMYRSILPVTFPFLISFTKIWFGRNMFLLWPILGTLLTLILLAFLLHSMHVTMKFAIVCVLLTLISAPFLFYSATVWEMTLACVFPMAMLLFLRKRHALLAGAVLGLGLWFREECAVIAVCTACSMLCAGYRTKRDTFHRMILFFLGFIFVGIPLVIYNYEIFGHVLGLHGALYYSHNVADVAPVAPWIRCMRGYWLYLFRFDGHIRVSRITEYILYLPLLLLPIAGAFHCRKIRLAVLCCAGLSWTGFFLLALCSMDSITYAGLNTGFIANSPLYAGFFLSWREQLLSSRKFIRTGAVIAVCYCVIMPLLLTQTDIGVIWGARHFLLLAPLFLLLSIDGFRRIKLPRFPLKKVFLWFFMLAVTFSVYGSYAVITRTRLHDEIATQLPRDVIVTDAFLLPEMAPELVKEGNNIFYVKSDTQLMKLLAELRGHVDSFDFVLCSANPYYGFITDECLERLGSVPWICLENTAQINPNQPSFMQFTVMHIRLLPEESGA